MHHIFFLQLVMDMWAIFHFGSVVNNAAVNICVQVLVGEMFLFL